MVIFVFALFQGKQVRDFSNPDKLALPENIPRLHVGDLDKSTVAGLCECVWPGRAQTLKRPGLTYYLDGAHTLESIQVC